MQLWEASELLSMVEFSDRNTWEQTRSMMHLYTLSHSSKGKKVSAKDIIPFAWDKSEPKTITTTDKERIRKRAEYIKQKYINNG